MIHTFEPSAESDSADMIFRRAPWIGFTVGTEFVPFVMTRSSKYPNDWQGGRKTVTDEIWGSNRVLIQDGGARALILTTGLLFENRERFQTFWAMQPDAGMLRMNLSWTMHAPTREWHEHGVDYAEFDAVEIVSVSGLTFDLAKRPQCDVVFQRGDTTWG